MKKSIWKILVIDLIISMVLIGMLFLCQHDAIDIKNAFIVIALSAIWSVVYKFMINYSEKRDDKASQIAIVGTSIVFCIFFVFVLVQSFRDSRFIEFLVITKSPVVVIVLEFFNSPKGTSKN